MTMIPNLPLDAALPDVAVWMEEVGGSLRPDDGFRHFNTVYTMVTRQVIARVAAGECADPAFVSRLDVVFARRYQDALIATDAFAPRAWCPMRERRFDTSITPFQFAMAGMNAHINRDLVHALIDTAAELGWSLDRDTARYRDYENVNELLVALMNDAKDLLMSNVGHSVDQSLGKVDDLLEVWSISRARSAAWTNAEIAQALGAATVGNAHLHAIDRTTGMVGRLLLA